MLISTFLTGFFLSLSLILAIGAQNAFVIKQGLKRQYVFVVCLICALSDALLIGLGVSGFSIILQQFPQWIVFAKIAGALFLLVYGILSLRAAWTKNHDTPLPQNNSGSLIKVILTCLAFTWLNPHVYLDTLILLGMVSADSNHKPLFALGAISASLIFFFALGYGARLFLPLFTKPKAWNVLDAVVGIMMLALAISLLWH